MRNDELMKNSAAQLAPLSDPRTIVIRTPDAATSPDLSFHDGWLFFLKRSKLIVGCALGAALFVFVCCLLMTPKYEAQSLLEISAQNTDVLGQGSDFPGSGSDGEHVEFSVAMQTEASALESDSLALQVARELNLESHEPFAPKTNWWSKLRLIKRLSFFTKGKETPVDWSCPIENSPERRANFLDTFQRNFKVKQVPDARMLSVIFYNPDPELAANVVNRLVSDYIDRQYHERYEATLRSSEWLAQQLQELKREREEKQKEAVNYQRENGIVGTDEVHNIVISKLGQLDTELTAAEGNRIMKEALYRLSQNISPEVIGSLEDSESVPGAASVKPAASVLPAMRLQENDLKSQIAQLSAKFGSAYPRLIELRKQLEQVQANIQTEQKRISDRFAAEYLAASDSEKMLRSALQAQKREANTLNDRAVQFTILKHEADASRDLYEELNKKLKSARMMSGIHSDNVIVVDPAYPDDEPSRPRTLRYTVLGFVLGGFLGLGLGVLFESFDDTVRTPHQVESALAMAALGVVPEMPSSRNGLASGRLRLLKSRNGTGGVIPSWSEPRGEASEAYRALRTSLAANNLRVLVITSPLPGEGKSTTALNLAATLARQSKRILLMEADMRSSMLHHALQVGTAAGLSTFLKGETGLSDSIHPYSDIPGLFIMPAGPRPQRPSELLASSEFNRAIHYLSRAYDCIVIDTPPILSVTDAAVVARSADAVLLVARFGMTTRNSLLRAREILNTVKARCLGVVLNCTDVDSADFRYYAGGNYRRDSYYQDSSHIVG